MTSYSFATFGEWCKFSNGKPNDQSAFDLHAPCRPRSIVRLRRKISDNAFILSNSWSVPSLCTSPSQWRGLCFFCKGRDTSSICCVPRIPESPNPVVFLFNPLLVKCADGPCRGVFPQRVNCALQCRKTVGVVGGQYRIKLLTFQIPGATVELALNVRRRAPCLVIKGFQTLRFLDSPLLVKIADNTAICVPLYL